MIQSQPYYLVAGQHKACSDYDGYAAITTASACATAASALQLDCTTVTTISSNIYPLNCYYNLAGISCSSGYKLYFNPGPSSYTTGQSSRFPICKRTDSSTPTSICSIGLGRVQSGSVTPPSDISSYLQCGDTFTFEPFNRDGYIHYVQNYLEPGWPWGFQRWQLDVNTATNPETLWNSTDQQPYYDKVEGVAVDNTRDIGYTFLSHKWNQNIGTAWERRLMQINLETGAATVLLNDYYPYNCYRLDVPNQFRAVMDIDEVNNILYWMGMNQDEYLCLYSLNLNSSPLQVITEFIFAFGVDEQLSQLHVDCNGNVWFTQRFNGLYLWSRGWQQPVLVINEAKLAGITTIRRDNSMEMDWVIAYYFTARKYDKTGLISNSYTTYPSPPNQVYRTGSSGDIMHFLSYDYQNKKMCVNTKSNDGDYMLFCYDPIPPADPNLVWNYIKLPSEREGMAVRYGNYTPETPKPNGTIICDAMDLDSVRYRWIGGNYVATQPPTPSPPGPCTDGTFDTAPCIEINYAENMETRIDTSGFQDVQIEFNLYLTGLESGEGVHLLYDCDGNGYQNALSWIRPSDSNINGHQNSGVGTTGIEYTLNDTTCNNNNNVRVKYQMQSSFNSEKAYIDNFCVYGNAAATTPSWPANILPFCDDLSDYTNSGYWTDYADTSQSGVAVVEQKTSSNCIGTASCARISYFGELNFNDFSTKNMYDLYIKFNLCLGCDSSSKMLNTEYFYVKYSCDDTYNYQILATYDGSLLATWGGINLPDQVFDLPSQCNNVEKLRIKFQLEANGNDVYIDSFCIKTKTPQPSTSPTAEPSKSPTKTPSQNPSVPPSKSPTKTGDTRNPTTAPSLAPTKTGATRNPSDAPTKSPTENPTSIPSVSPSATIVSETDTKDPTNMPSKAPLATVAKAWRYNVIAILSAVLSFCVFCF